MFWCAVLNGIVIARLFSPRVVFVGSAEIASKTGYSVENLGVSPMKKRKYSSKDPLCKDIVENHEIVSQPATGPKNGQSTLFLFYVV